MSVFGAFLSRRPGSASPWRSALQRIVLILGVALLTGEAAVRAVSIFLPAVQYLATVRIRPRPQHYQTLEAFLEAQTTHLVPYRAWNNHFNNSQGFNDAEFEIPKPPGRYRIVSLGDSFCFSMAPYPDAVQTLIENELGRRCGRDLDLLNAGIAATGLWEYRTLFDFMLPVWQPDAVVLHFYLGNDGPDLFKHSSDLPFRKEPAFHSYFLTYVRNAVKVLKSRGTSSPPPVPPRTGQVPATVKKGGAIVDPARPPVTDRDPALSGPAFSAEAFRDIMAHELGRLYVPKDGVEPDWEPVVRILDDVRRMAESAGVRFLIVLYPSQLQTDRDFREATLAAVTTLRGYRGLEKGRIDPLAPNRYLLEWCRRSGAACFDLTPHLAREARQESGPLYIERDSHWNIRGNRLAAAAETGFLESELCPGSADARAPSQK